MSWDPISGSLDLLTLQALYRSGQLQPPDLVAAIDERIERCLSDNIWIYRLPQAEVVAQARRLAALSPAERTALPLYGIPYAVKDNLDLAGHPTTVGCPTFSYTPIESATVVRKLAEAGALLIGKTNLDQFATGLVGTRSPYGPCRNPFDPAFIAGGSSSGSAVAVAAGLVSFALGTDTAGSGRVPAGFNNIVGLKPSRGLLSTYGVFPACRSLDCVSILALTCEDALAVFEATHGPDPTDPFSRIEPATVKKYGSKPDFFRFGLPDPAHLNFFGNKQYATLFQAAVDQLVALGGEKVEIDFAPLAETARLLYGGPWVVERLAAVRNFLNEQPEALLPVTRQVIEGGRRFSAVDVYESYYRLRAYRQQVALLWHEIDVLLVPTTGTIYTLAQVEAEPLALNTNLGYYTNFVNLLDLCAWAVPNGFQPNGLPMGVSLIGPAFQERYLAGIAAALHRQRSQTLGATRQPHPAGSGNGYGQPSTPDKTMLTQT